MTDKMRDEFEKWYLMQPIAHKSHIVRISNGHYFGAHTETAWRAWQAAQSVSVPVAGEVVAWADPRHLSMVRPGVALTGIYLSGMETPDYPTPLIIQPTTSISAAELDALRKDAERLQFMIDETAILMYSVGIDRTLCRVEWPLTGYVQYAFYLSERAAIDAAIAQGKGE